MRKTTLAILLLSALTAAGCSMNPLAATGIASSAIGGNSKATGDYSMATGGFSKATGDYSMANGWKSHASGIGSVAIGWGSVAKEPRTVSVGSGESHEAIPATRRIVNVTDGTDDQDAATIAQLRALEARIKALESGR